MNTSQPAIRAQKVPDMDESWLRLLRAEFSKDYMVALSQFLKAELKQYVVYPPMREVFTAFKWTAFDNVRVVILGQDPYHGKGQAHGLSFSVKENIPPPPSLKNIFKEINADLKLDISALRGTLTAWSAQGVFLLNTVLTVRSGQAASHRGRGWEQFTDKVLTVLNENRTGLVFMLWGRFAHEKASLLDATRHKILTAPHPSPYSAASGFFGCRHFSAANAYLQSQNLPTIDWRIK
ncbi:uracil-DNA glycosylase [Spirochaetota bacterium]|nr:uracil-DNA glycosylase [Spirochaetota bacterium]